MSNHYQVLENNFVHTCRQQVCRMKNDMRRLIPWSNWVGFEIPIAGVLRNGSTVPLVPQVAAALAIQMSWTTKALDSPILQDNNEEHGRDLDECVRENLKKRSLLGAFPSECRQKHLAQSHPIQRLINKTNEGPFLLLGNDEVEILPGFSRSSILYLSSKACSWEKSAFSWMKIHLQFPHWMHLRLHSDPNSLHRCLTSLLQRLPGSVGLPTQMPLYNGGG